MEGLETVFRGEGEETLRGDADGEAVFFPGDLRGHFGA